MLGRVWERRGAEKFGEFRIDFGEDVEEGEEGLVVV